MAQSYNRVEFVPSSEGLVVTWRRTNLMAGGSARSRHVIPYKSDGKADWDAVERVVTSDQAKFGSSIGRASRGPVGGTQ